MLSRPAHPDLAILDNPKAANDRLRCQLSRNCLTHLQHVWLGLRRRPQHDQPEVLGGWITADVRKPEIERDEPSTLKLNDRRKVRIGRPAELLFVDRCGVMTGRPKRVGNLNRKILIDFESHAEVMERRACDAAEPALGPQGEDALARQIGSVRENCADVIVGEPWIAGENLGTSDTRCEIVENHTGKNARAADARLPVTDHRIDNNTLAPVHGVLQPNCFET